MMTSPSNVSPVIRQLAKETAEKVDQWDADKDDQRYTESIILAALRQAQQVQREQDAPYMQHKDDCEIVDTWTPQRNCTCGFATLRSQEIPK